MSMKPSTAPRLGIDISKLTFDACLIMPDQSFHQEVFANTDEGFGNLDAWLRRRKVTQVAAGLEATGPYGQPLLAHLHGQGHCVYQLNPRRVKDYAKSQGRRVKTDAVDARLIATYLQHGEHLQSWQPPSAAIVELQALVRRRQQVLDMLQAERNRQEAKWMPTCVAKSLKRQIQQLKAEATGLFAAINKHLLKYPELQKSVRLLRSIPGVGLMVAVTILAEVPAMASFGRARQVAAFAGLTPALAQSGTSVRRRGSMSREGSALLRKMLYMAALQTVMRPTNAFHSCYVAMVQRGKAKMCTLGAMMHKILRVAFGVLKHETPFAPNLAKLPG
jgi:transposase